MASHNPVTGDALISRVINKNYSDNYDKVDLKAKIEYKVFVTYACSTCNIKVSTSNGLCPCCGKDLVQK